MKVNEIGEIGLIKRIGSILRSKYLGDDCAVLDIGTEYLVVTIDMLHRVTDFPREMTGERHRLDERGGQPQRRGRHGRPADRRRRGHGHSRGHGRRVRGRHRPRHGTVCPDIRHRDRRRRHRPAPGADHGDDRVGPGGKDKVKLRSTARRKATCCASTGYPGHAGSRLQSAHRRQASSAARPRGADSQIFPAEAPLWRGDETLRLSRRDGDDGHQRRPGQVGLRAFERKQGRIRRVCR